LLLIVLIARGWGFDKTVVAKLLDYLVIFGGRRVPNLKVLLPDGEGLESRQGLQLRDSGLLCLLETIAQRTVHQLFSLSHYVLISD
jgi:hypothetical protein